MSEHIARRALDTASQLGAGYADVRIVRRRDQNVSVKSGRVEGVSLGETEGFGVRVVETLRERWRFGDNWQVQAEAGYEKYNGDIADSPIAVDDYEMEIGISILYRF